MRIRERLLYRAVRDLNHRIMTDVHARPQPNIVVGLNHGGAVVGGMLYYLNRARFHFTVLWTDVNSAFRSRNLRLSDFASELAAVASEVKAQTDAPPVILLVDDTLRTGKALGPALDLVRRTVPDAALKVGVVLYRPDLARFYDPSEVTVVTPDPSRFSTHLFDLLYYE